MMVARAGALVGVAAVGYLAAAVPGAEASFPGGNGVLAFGRLGPGLATTTIALVDLRSGRTREITHVPARCAGRSAIWDDSDPSFSASGRLLIYTHADDCDRRTPDGTYVIRPDGGGSRLLTRKLLDHPVLSPSGESVASEDDRDRTLITDIDQPERHRELLPRSRYSITKWPAWSATGRLALTVSGGGRESGHIATVSAQGRDLRLVTRSRRDVMPDWSPSGDRIAFAREKGNRTDILVVSARGRSDRRPQRLTHTRNAQSPVWSPNGRHIAYVRGNSIFEPASLVIMRARDGGRQRLVENRADVISGISWQPRPRR
jgi:TolB protein